MEWTNEALHPSRIRERGLDTAQTVTGQLVDDCAANALAVAAVTQFEPASVYVGNSTIVSGHQQFASTMLMSFHRDGVDSVSQVTPRLQEPFLAELYTHQCQGQTYHLAYMPKCGNLARLTPVDDAQAVPQQGWQGGWLPGGPYQAPQEVSAPATLPLVLLGLALLIKKRR